MHETRHRSAPLSSVHRSDGPALAGWSPNRFVRRCRIGPLRCEMRRTIGRCRRESGVGWRHANFEQWVQPWRGAPLSVGSAVPHRLQPEEAMPIPAFAVMPADMNVEPGEGQVAESYLLPITPPLDQGDSDLCWVYATLSMLETNYMVRHPGSQIALSRGALERDAIADRLLRLIRGEPRNLDNGGLAVEALALIRQNGLLAEDDFYDVLDPDPIQK